MLNPLGKAAFVLWPLLRAVQQAQQLDALALDAVDDDERRAADDQLASAFFSSWSSHLRMLQKHVYLALDLLILADRGQWVVLGDVVQLLKSIGAGQGQPFDSSQAVACAFLAQAARRLALVALTASFDTH